MKHLHAAIVGLALVSFCLALVHTYRARTQVDAQESPKDAKIDMQPDQTQPEGGLFGFSGDRPFPTIWVDDVISLLKTSTEELIEKKLAKNSDELREHLNRTQHSIRLPSPLTKELAPQDLYRRTIESMFLVAGMTKPTEKETAWQTSFSTAFAVHEDGILSTSAHVFDHDDHDNAVVVLDVWGKVHPIVELLAVDRKGDTCLFRIDKKGLKPLPLGKEMPPGSAVRVIGHPGDSFFFFSAGNIANYERDEDGLIWLNVTADFGQGSSGGPVMDSAGNIVGQVSRTYTLYAGGESSQRKRRPRIVRQANDGKHQQKSGDGKEEKEEEPKTGKPDDSSTAKKTADPQMVFKACTPVSAIRALVK